MEPRHRRRGARVHSALPLLALVAVGSHPSPAKTGVSRRPEGLATCDCLWKADAPLGMDRRPHSCEMVRMADTSVLAGGGPPQLCIRNYSEVISDSFRKVGNWPDCADLSKLWESVPARTSWRRFSAFAPCGGLGGRKLFVDVGANIGACTLQMLARPDVLNVVAFEPNPENLFYLTSSVLANKDYAAKLALYPLALGSRRGEFRLWVDRSNPGNSAVGTRVQRRMRRGLARVESTTLDDIFFRESKPPYIHVLKMDAQGSEVQILKGATRLLASGAVGAVKFEFARLWLRWHGEEPIELFSLLHCHGYGIYKDDGGGGLGVPLTRSRLRVLACTEGHYVADFVALGGGGNRSPGQLRRPLAC